MALGARPRDVVIATVRHGVAPAAVGGAFGLVAAAALSRLVQGLLFEVGTLDLKTYVAVGTFALFLAASAAWIPARRAARIDPAQVLRSE